jgi:hypothetical protein
MARATTTARKTSKTTTKPKTKKTSSSRVAKPKPDTLTITLSSIALNELEKRAVGMTKQQYLTTWLEKLLEPKVEKPPAPMNPHLARNLAVLERAYGGR